MDTRMKRVLLTLTAAAVALFPVHASFCGLYRAHVAPEGQEDELPARDVSERASRPWRTMSERANSWPRERACCSRLSFRTQR